MGLIRKTLAVSTLGGVSGSSKKQRVAKQQLNATLEIRDALLGSAIECRAAKLGQQIARQNTDRAQLRAELANPATGPNRRRQIENLLLV